MIRKLLILSIMLLMFVPNCFAQEASSEENKNFTINLTEPSIRSFYVLNLISITPNDSAFDEFIKATNKFKQNNTEIAYDDYLFVLNNIHTNDFVYTLMSQKLVDYGFFNLAFLAAQKIKDPDITRNHIESVQKYFYPRKKLTAEQEIYLAEAYSNIMFNAQSEEAKEELLSNKVLINTSDYAKYILALASLKSNDLENAKKYIQLAINQHPQNLNYKILQARILANDTKPQEALKVLNLIKKEELTDVEFQRRANSIEQYVLYKCANSEWKKNYHLAQYYYYEGDLNKSLKTIQNASSKNKKDTAKINALMGKLYLAMQEYEKAEESAKTALKNDAQNSDARLILGNINYLKQNYKKALKDYKIAACDKSNGINAEIKIAQTYQKLDNKKEAKECLEKIVKSSSTAYEAYYNLATLERVKYLIYMKKSLSANITYLDAWIALARFEIDRKNFNLAQNYLSTAYYIDQNDFRYYYYQGLVYKNQNDSDTAAEYFEKCLKLNPNCTEAQKEMDL